jgi:hypothetical protein
MRYHVELIGKALIQVIFRLTWLSSADFVNAYPSYLHVFTLFLNKAIGLLIRPVMIK